LPAVHESSTGDRAVMKYSINIEHREVSQMKIQSVGREFEITTAKFTNKIYKVRFEVFTAVTMKNGVFWDVTPCGSYKLLLTLFLAC
jgi:hypothetical protein